MEFAEIIKCWRPHIQIVSVGTGDRVPTKVSLWMLEQVRELIFVGEATVIRVSPLL